ncbi:DUF431-domain-containing protein [Ascodesmis nigricans]|uniref:DUF431-domain-containing protein n=1 Tax=Ascodesmis nigricans TaxID=341454 RepID=A0A4S2MUS8_9PEZI|nr:DUF431-domain-containing protein [Ascodesmis nigricans]
MSNPSSTPHTYVVEHLEPELGTWSLLEYTTIASETALPSRFYLSSLPTSLASNLPAPLPSLRSESFVTTTQNIEELVGEEGKHRVCLLDPQAEEELTPADAERFDWFVFGGILGDEPPRDRTSELRKYGYTGRNLRKMQMTTDTAVRVTRMVIDGQQSLDAIPFTDYPELKLGKHETTTMPFRYVRDAAGNPVMPDGMLDLIKKDADKSLDDLF